MQALPVVSFIPIRCNSKRLPGKNFLKLSDKPLCWHAARRLLPICPTYVFCSDPSVMKHVPNNTRFQERPIEFDADETKGLPIYQHFARCVPAEIYILSHATSPFLETSHIQKGLDAVLSGAYDSAFAAMRFQTFAWFNDKPLNYSLCNVPRTQDIKPVFVETSGFYIYRRELIEQGQRIGECPFVVEVDQIAGLDIDTEADWLTALRVGGGH